MWYKKFKVNAYYLAALKCLRNLSELDYLFCDNYPDDQTKYKRDIKTGNNNDIQMRAIEQSVSILTAFTKLKTIYKKQMNGAIRKKSCKAPSDVTLALMKAKIGNQGTKVYSTENTTWRVDNTRGGTERSASVVPLGRSRTPLIYAKGL
jgi:hypothetical protein